MSQIETVSKQNELLPRIERIKHTNFGSGIPYYDDELKMAQSEEHAIAISYLFYCFRFIAKNLGLACLSDHPVWYLLPKPKNGKTQKGLYPDLCVSKNLDTEGVIADDLVFCLEVVSTERRRKEVKDTVIMKGLNEYNRVSEFVLIYPKASDNRAIEYYRYNGFYYVPISPQGGEYSSHAIADLSIREIPRDDWKDGEKVEVLYKGKVLVKYDELWDMMENEQEKVKREQKRAERERLEKEKEQKIAKKERAEKERERAEKERERAEKEKLAKKLRELGFDPDTLVASD
ncbi:MAG: hypothetical protein H7A23_09420 [Leptospiraceae bacterium]|nr:hypothetical protein [Leptospiraceae bacterium]